MRFGQRGSLEPRELKVYMPKASRYWAAMSAALVLTLSKLFATFAVSAAMRASAASCFRSACSRSAAIARFASAFAQGASCRNCTRATASSWTAAYPNRAADRDLSIDFDHRV